MTRLASRRALLGGLASLPALTVPAISATDPHVAYRTSLHAAYAEYRQARPIGAGAMINSVEDQAATLVRQRIWALCDEVLSLEIPTTLDGLGTVGLAYAIHCEGTASLVGGMAVPDDDRSVAVAQAVLAITREPLPDGWTGWGNEPDFRERESAFYNEEGCLPAWAIEEARRCA